MLSPMSDPQRKTYAITVATFLQHNHFQKEAHCELFLQTAMRYREQGKFLVHGFAVMPNHGHLLISPAEDQTLPKCVQFIKGGYSFAARTLTPKEIWQHGYHEHRVRDLRDYDNQLRYIANNPPAARLGDEYPFVHTHARWKGFIDPCPPWLLE